MPPPPTPPPPPNRRYSPLELAILSAPLLIGIGAGWYYSGEAHDAVGVTAIGVTAALGYIGLSILSLASWTILYTLAVTGYAWVAPVAFFVGRAVEKEDAQQRSDRDE